MEKEYTGYAHLFKALSDETRLRIFTMLTEGELCACNILEKFQITQPTLSYHMKILIESGLVKGRKDGIWMKYSIHAERLNNIQELLNSIGTKAEKKQTFQEEMLRR
ncbi:MAG: winged helix-turn-helix transcriptional regulator [Eubacteriaceae bacterium]|nr:winged helix-turn-helix transcriptional regulator [Eubacteriaceae bacterium]